MPRVKINQKKYMIRDLSSWIVGRMHAKGLRQEDVAKWIGINQQSFSRRLRMSRDGVDEFSFGELVILFKNLDATDEDILRLIKMKG